MLRVTSFMGDFLMSRALRIFCCKVVLTVGIYFLICWLNFGNLMRGYSIEMRPASASMGYFGLNSICLI